jgi:hypothetical protein
VGLGDDLTNPSSASCESDAESVDIEQWVLYWTFFGPVERGSGYSRAKSGTGTEEKLPR